MKLQSSHIVFLIIGLVAGYVLSQVLHQIREAPPESAPSPPAVTLAPEVLTGAEGKAETESLEGPQADASAPAQPKIWVESTTYDTGVVPNHTKTVKEVPIANKGTAPLKITDVKTTCGCVAAAITDKIVAPDSATTLAITIDPKRIGGFKSKKTLTIFSNDPNNPRLRIDVLTQIEPEFALEPDNIEFGEVQKGAAAEASLILRQLGDEPIEVLDVKPWGSVQGLELSAEEIPPDQWVKPGHREYRIKAKLSPEMSPGFFLGRFKIQTTCKRMPFASSFAKAAIKAFYSITPNSVVLHNHRANVQKASATVAVSADRPFEITNLSATDEAILLSTRPGNKPNTTFIDLKLAPEARPGSWNQKVSFNVQSGEEVYQEQVHVRLLVRNMKLGVRRPETRPLVRPGTRPQVKPIDLNQRKP